MDTVLVQGLIITVIGMGLVFAALIMLWGLMALLSGLSRVVDRRRQSSAVAAPEAPAAAPGSIPTGPELAAIATALMLLRAEHEAEGDLQWRLPPILTRWVAVGYSRQLRGWQPRRTQRDA